MNRYRQIIINTLIRHQKEEVIRGRFSDEVVPLLDCLDENIQFCKNNNLKEEQEKLTKLTEKLVSECSKLCRVWSNGDFNEDYDKPDKPIVPPDDPDKCKSEFRVIPSTISIPDSGKVSVKVISNRDCKNEYWYLFQAFTPSFITIEKVAHDQIDIYYNEEERKSYKTFTTSLVRISPDERIRLTIKGKTITIDQDPQWELLPEDESNICSESETDYNKKIGTL